MTIFVAASFLPLILIYFKYILFRYSESFFAGLGSQYETDDSYKNE